MKRKILSPFDQYLEDHHINKNQLRITLLRSTNERCAYCGNHITLSTMEIDHIDPQCKGGIHEITNLNPSCKACNRSKGGRDIEEFKLRSWFKKAMPLKESYTFKQVKEMERLGMFDNLPSYRQYTNFKFYYQTLGEY